MDNKKFLTDLFKAYYLARKHKRQTASAIAFELNYETNLLKLGRELLSGSYEIGKSICFICFKPLQREIFAADFRDRIIHHLIYNYINPIFERSFICDSYSCQIGKGTSYGIKRLDHFIRSCSKNYKEECYVLKLDIRGYFMSIDKDILYEKIERKIVNFKGNKKFNQKWLLALIHKVIFHDPTENCVIKGLKEDWVGLPKSKSLFGAAKSKGLPIGNLTSQLFGNVYLDDFDHFIKYRLDCQYYGRYVDDIVIVHPNKDYLKSIIPIIRQYLKSELLLDLHPKKIYLQNIKLGVRFLGTIIKPYRRYVLNGIKANFFKKIKYWNQELSESIEKYFPDNFGKFLPSMNSYLGVLGGSSTYKLRRKILQNHLSPRFRAFVCATEDYRKLVFCEPVAIINNRVNKI